MARKIVILTKSNMDGERLKNSLNEEMGLRLRSLSIADVYNIDADLNESELEMLGKELFSDNVAQTFSYKETGFPPEQWKVEIGFLPGVTDNVGKTAKEGLKEILKQEINVYFSRMYAFDGELNAEKCEAICERVANKLIERWRIIGPGENDFVPFIPKIDVRHVPEVKRIELGVNDGILMAISKERLLALNVEEMREIRNYLQNENVLKARRAVGLDERITDVEIEVLAQTWSEHCKHKIFNAMISYHYNGEPHAINSLFKTFIKGATDIVKKPYVVSVFKDNGGIIKFNHQYDVAIKVETHNAPCALDPYGGALTGILGVNRDVVGTGLGAKPVANIDVFCFGMLDEKEVPKGALHPKRIARDVVKGIEHGGNKVGIPTVNGSITFERAYRGRPVVYCGTVGIMPSEINGRRTSEKKIEPGYLAVMVGGRIGKDGIHGATFSSQQITEGIPPSVVQIGDPITQKKTVDFCLEARDKQLYEAITDNGAGGLSSSIGELAQFSNGCEIYLETCPLKYPGLDPWEIVVSESQERMTLAVPKEKMPELIELARKHDVEVTVVGRFTNTGKFHVFYEGKTVAYLDLRFMHEGVPQMKLKAVWKRKRFDEPVVYETDLLEVLKALLASPNIASKENVIRQYDHEVQGGSVIKPLMDGNNAVPCDAAVLRPLLDSDEGLVISHGICPKYIQDAYDMAAVAFDEAVRNAVACGAKPGYLACLDNFAWPDPIFSLKTPDGEYKLAQLVRSCIALYDYTIAYGIPLVSGKDSMKNDYYIGEEKYSILPTLLITVIGKIDDVKKVITSEFKKPNDLIYILGITRKELGGSEYYKLFSRSGWDIGDTAPKVRANETIPLYKALARAIEDGLVKSAHDISDGGLAVTLAECSFSGFGVDVDISHIPNDNVEEEDALLFSESAGRFIVSVDEGKAAEFEKQFVGLPCARVGRVRGDRRFIIRNNGDITLNTNVDELREIWKNGLRKL